MRCLSGQDRQQDRQQGRRAQDWGGPNPLCDPPRRSLPAIEDIRDCLQNTNLHRKFVALFRKALQDRLLHPGGLRLSGCELGRAEAWLAAGLRG